MNINIAIAVPSGIVYRCINPDIQVEIDRIYGKFGVDHRLRWTISTSYGYICRSFIRQIKKKSVMIAHTMYIWRMMQDERQQQQQQI